jgi:hypothetical protein
VAVVWPEPERWELAAAPLPPRRPRLARRALLRGRVGVAAAAPFIETSRSPLSRPARAHALVGLVISRRTPGCPGVSQP